jgi:SAM-dependent methyltransferase
MTKGNVKIFYENHVLAEWKRLVNDAYHRLEYDTSLHFLKKYLPEKGLILDAGGGPGRYTIEMARRGYDVVLLDLVRQSLDFAEQQIKRAKVQSRVREVVEGSISDLSQFPDASFDGVLCLGGPLSHIVDESERAHAVSELVRVAKPGSPIFVSVMSRLAVLVTVLIQTPKEIAMDHFETMRDTGHYLGEYGFTCCHFFLPEELRDAFEKTGVNILEMAGLEGISANKKRNVNTLAKEGGLEWRRWLETHFQTCTHPSVVGMSEHMLIVVQKKVVLQ